MTDNKFVMFFRSDINQELLVETELRIDIMKKIEEINALQNLQGVNFFQEWGNLFKNVTNLWQQDLQKGLPFFKMDITILDKLAFYFDFVAQYFLYNGSEIDNDFLKSVDEFFQQHKIHRGEQESKELFNKAFKNKNNA